jgi:hypothetical protein
MEGKVKGFAKFQHKIEGREVKEEEEVPFYSLPPCTFPTWERLMRTPVDLVDAELIMDSFGWSSSGQTSAFWSLLHDQLVRSGTLGHCSSNEASEARAAIRSWQSQTGLMRRVNG